MTNEVSTKLPQVDIVIPFHKVDKYLYEAIRSASESKGIVPHVILVNDSGQSPIFERLQISIDMTILETKERGYANALNTALPHLKSRYLAFLDSDDLQDSQRIFKQIQSLEFSQADISICGIRKFSDKKHKLRSKLNSKSVAKFDPFIHLISFMYTNSTWVIDLEKFKYIIEWNKTVDHTLCDWLFFQQNVYTKGRRVTYLSEPYYWQRVHGGQISKNVKEVTPSLFLFREWNTLAEDLGITGVIQDDCNSLMYPWAFSKKHSIKHYKHDLKTIGNLLTKYLGYLRREEPKLHLWRKLRRSGIYLSLVCKRIALTYIPKI